ncbi:MAG: DUF4388 domain-containing protein [Chloroflexi bacterium]|nr:DUF4388 domain-containing protein [Chloroflexota bacterium]
MVASVVTGSLYKKSLDQLLDLIELAQKTGKLHFSGYAEPLSVYFQDGRVTYSQIGKEKAAMYAVVVSCAKLLEGRLNLLRLKRELSDVAFSLHLMDRFGMSREEILQYVTRYYAETVVNGVFWRRRTFEFFEGEQPPEDVVTTRLRTGDVVRQAQKMVVEVDHIVSNLPSGMQSIICKTDLAQVEEAQTGIGYYEWKALHFIDNQRDIIQLSDAIRMERTELIRIIYNLSSMGLVNIYSADKSTYISPGAKTRVLSERSLFRG